MLKGKRKILVIVGLAVVTIGAATAMVFAGEMDGAQWVELAKWVGASSPLAFALGNGLEHIGNGKKST